MVAVSATTRPGPPLIAVVPDTEKDVGLGQRSPSGLQARSASSPW
jgi:hypothetical protein